MHRCMQSCCLYVTRFVFCKSLSNCHFSNVHSNDYDDNADNANDDDDDGVCFVYVFLLDLKQSINQSIVYMTFPHKVKVIGSK